MKNKMSDLNNHLFAQMERLADGSLSIEDLDREVKRAEAIVKLMVRSTQGLPPLSDDMCPCQNVVPIR